MESIKPEDRSKVIALVVSLVLVLGFVAFQLSKAFGSGSAKGAVVGSATTPAVVPPVESTPRNLIDVPTLFASNTLDPFQKVLPDKNAAPVTVAARTDRAGSNNSFSVPTMPPAIEGNITPVPIGTGSSEVAIKPVAPRLKGIVFGSKPIAVLQLDQDEFVVGVGQTNATGFTVEKIDSAGVDIRRGDEKIHLSLDPA